MAEYRIRGCIAAIGTMVTMASVGPLLLRGGAKKVLGSLHHWCI